MALCAAAGAAGAAECPTAADLVRGIRATYADGSVFDYRLESADMVRIVERPDPGGPAAVSFLSRFGLYDAEAQGLVDDQPQPGQTLRYDYAAQDGSEPPRPRPEEVWLGRSATTYADGARDEAVAVMVFGRQSNLSIGGCAYDSIPVVTSYVMGDNWAAQEFDWLPALGIGLLSRRAGSDAPRASLYTVRRLSLLAE